MLLYIRYGYNMRHLRALWRRVPLNADVFDLVWTSFDLVRHTCSELVLSEAEQLQMLELPLQMCIGACLSEASGRSSSMGAD
eukprot:5109491-Pyramimonas_sp.AAC.1